MRIVLAVCAGLLAYSACLTSAESRERPSIDSIEGGLWAVSDDAERNARQSAELNEDLALNMYVRNVVCRVAPGHCGEIRLYVMNRPFLNAMMMPNGYGEVWSGLLLRAENESELAFVLGHEIAHFAETHSLSAHTNAKKNAQAGTILSMGIGLAGAVVAQNSSSPGSILDISSSLMNLVYLGSVASMFAFSREQEIEADTLGFRFALKAGYDPLAGAALWRKVINETQASDSKKVRESLASASIFDSHPLSADRLAALATLGEDRGSDTKQESASEYRSVIRPFLGQWLRDDLRRRDYGQTLHLIARLEELGEDTGLLAYFRGEVFRTRRGEGDLARAATAYAEATSRADAPPEAWREAGAAWLRSGETSRAAEAFRRYLELKPDAPDRMLVEMDLELLEE